MRVISDLRGSGRYPTAPTGTVLVASVDGEWSKNYRITNGTGRSATRSCACARPGGSPGPGPLNVNA
jgi:hypothetical protein